jgi:hypothetical protein
MRAHHAWLAYAAVATLCTCYLNLRAWLVPRWGYWYLAGESPYVLLQVRAFLSGRLALIPHPAGAGTDYNWGRGGMHTAWGLGVPILSIPLHLLGRLFRAPGFPEDVQFLALYAVTALILARVLHGASRDEPSALATSAAAATFVMVFPTFVGMVSSRFFVYELTIATGAMWSVLQLAGVLALLYRCTPGRLVAVCVVAGFSTMIRPPLAVYGLTTATMALIVAQRGGVRPRALLAALLAYVATTGLYFLGNLLRFGSILSTGYENCVSGGFVNRMTRWGVPFAKAHFMAGVKELFATFFLLRPVAWSTLYPPPEIQRYAVPLERFREYYCPTYDLFVFGLWLMALGIVGFRVIRRRLWRKDADLRGEVGTIIGVWALPPSIVLFLFYAQAGNLVTRYATDLYPAFAAACLCVGIVVVGAVRRHAPRMTLPVQLVIGLLVVLRVLDWQGWMAHASRPSNRKALLSRIADIDSHRKDMPHVPDRFRCNGPRERPPVHNHLEDWWPDCSFRSAVVFALPYTPCVSLSLRTEGGPWGAQENESLDGLHLTADFDKLVSCGPPRVEGETRRVTMCEPHRPPFLLDGMRLYAVVSIDANLKAIDRLRLMRIDSVKSCP